MPDLMVESLALRITGAAGDTGRIEEITLRALELLTRRLDELGDGRGAPVTDGRKASIDLGDRKGDELASAIANAWLQALRVRLEG